MYQEQKILAVNLSAENSNELGKLGVLLILQAAEQISYMLCLKEREFIG